MPDLPAHAQIVVIGGGIVGCSTAYHLAKLGKTDVAFLPTDGQVSPSDLALALAKGARMHGVTIVEDCAVTGITVAGGPARSSELGRLHDATSTRRVTGVVTNQGTIAADIVVNCGGQ